MMTKLRSAKWKRDDAVADTDADVDADAAYQSNTYMSPFQATQKRVTETTDLLLLGKYYLYNE